MPDKVLWAAVADSGEKTANLCRVCRQAVHSGRHHTLLNKCSVHLEALFETSLDSGVSRLNSTAPDSRSPSTG